MNNLIIADNYATFGEDGLTSNKVIYYKADNMVKFRANITNDPYGESEVVTVGGETYDKPYEQQYLTFEALENGTFNFLPFNNNEIYYSTDGKNWTKGNSVSVSVGDRVMWKGEMTPLEQDHSGGIGTFGSGEDADPSVTTILFKAYGNVMSLLYGDNFINNNTLIGTYTFNCLFRKTNVTETHNLILPATTLVGRCYWKMFYQCSEMVSMPNLPATTLAENCYCMIVCNCTKLTDNIPSELPATTLADYCYVNMFYGCTSLVVAPKLPATTLSLSCYTSMFQGCSNLEVAPELPAPVLTNNCYWHMFDGCKKLNFIKCLATNKSATSCCASWVKNVASTGTFIKADNITWSVGQSGTPSGWNVYDTSEEMPLYQAESHQMVATFVDDTTLTTKIYTKP